MRLEPTIPTLTAIRSIQMAKRDSDGYRIRKYFTLKSILFIMFANLKLVLELYEFIRHIHECQFNFVYIIIYSHAKYMRFAIGTPS